MWTSIRKSYLGMLIKGTLITVRRFLERRVTLQYPERKKIPRKGYRGEHRLKKDEHGHPKCTACFMCATACPAECIKIEAQEVSWLNAPHREKAPKRFEIDMLKCIYCGMCEEACPCDAIELTEQFTIVATSRQEKIYDIRRLLRN
jgi:NADH-quinone oxidoreductase subunit I